MTEPLPRARPEAELAFELRVVEGSSAGASLHVQGAGTRHLVGSSSACALRLHDPSISRRHFAAWLERGALRIEDLDSTNGLFVGNVRVLQAEVGDRTRIRLGGSVVEVLRVSATSMPTSRDTSFGRVVGASPAMRRIFPLLAELAVTETPILLEGEPGTGKELVAEVLHERGPRSATPFVVLSGGSANAAERLFGLSGRPGLLEAPGTLLLSDILSFPFPAQRALANALERRPVARADGSPLGPVRARVIVSSRRDVDLEVQHGRFDEALAAILGRVRVELPPLRLRDGDVRLLADYFWRRLEVGDRVLSPADIQRLEAHRWHGNVRELETTVAQLASGGEEPSPEEELRGGPDTPLGEIAERLLAADLPLVQARTWLGEAFDRRYLEKVLAAHDGNVSRAAAASGLARRYFQTLKTKHGIDPGGR